MMIITSVVRSCWRDSEMMVAVSATGDAVSLEEDTVEVEGSNMDTRTLVAPRETQANEIGCHRPSGPRSCEISIVY